MSYAQKIKGRLRYVQTPFRPTELSEKVTNSAEFVLLDSIFRFLASKKSFLNLRDSKIEFPYYKKLEKLYKKYEKQNEKTENLVIKTLEEKRIIRRSHEYGKASIRQELEIGILPRFGILKKKK